MSDETKNECHSTKIERKSILDDPRNEFDTSATNRIEAQELIRTLLLVLSDVSVIEERVNSLKSRAMKLYKKLDDIADGENPR